MKLRNTAIAASLSLMPLGQPLLTGTGTAFTAAAVILSVPEKINAQTIRLTCDVKTHVKYFDEVSWKDLRNRSQEFEINQNKKLVIKRETVFYKGENYDLKYNYRILTNDISKIVAISDDDMTTVKGGLSSSTVTLDLNSKTITTANHMNDVRGYSFSLHYGRCE